MWHSGDLTDLEIGPSDAWICVREDIEGYAMVRDNVPANLAILDHILSAHVCPVLIEAESQVWE
jgi:hypothetical protein